MKALAFVIAPDGEITSVYSDSLADLIDQGTATVTRASHVEPNPTGAGWLADMSPVGGPVMGPYRLRDTALEAELNWLDAELFS